MATKRSPLHITDVELSVSKINRLLRPLRNKCAILASATSRPSGSAAPITYGSSSLPILEARAPPPLDVLHDPKLVIARAHQESRSLDALARQIYAVTSAYRNVVQAALPGGGLCGSRQGLLSLTDVCAAVVGQNIRGEVAVCLAALEEEPDEAQETSLVDELYESVPVRFRSWTLISHATSEIVGTCPNHPMLMLSLLGVALIYGLQAESKTFLRSFLTALFRSPRHGIPPPITHPTHPSYLVELCNEWTRLAPESCAGRFTHQSFAAVTLEVLAEHGSAAVWTCKSITRLVQLLRTRDFECFLTFLRGLIEMLAARSKYKFLAHGHEEDHHSLLARLAKWTGVITTDFFSSVGDDAENNGVGDAHARKFYSIVEILASAHDAGLHLRAVDDDTGVRDPQASLVCAATSCLVVPLLSNTSQPHRCALLALLRAVDDAPRSSAFDALAHRPLAHLRGLAGALRTHDLGALERALWTSAIAHSKSPSLSSSERAALRAAFAEATAQERDCVDMATVNKERVRRAGIAPAQSTRSPPRKRARREMPPPRRASQQWLPLPSPSCWSTTMSVASTPSLSSVAPSSSSSSSSVCSARSFSGSPDLGAIAEPSEDEDEGITRGSRSRVVVRSSCADLKSVLADALRTRKDLKVERRRASLRAGRSCGRSASSERGRSSCDEDAVLPLLPSEGDVLDMFAYDDDLF